MNSQALEKAIEESGLPIKRFDAAAASGDPNEMKVDRPREIIPEEREPQDLPPKSLLETRSPVMQAFNENLDKVKATSLRLLMRGETGTGKTTHAKRVHAASKKAGKFVHVNCSAIPEGLFESLCFGHKKGAFTGATSNHAGYLEEANGGTLFLDEIGDIPLAVQAKLLTALEEGVIRPVGSTKPVKTNFRLVSATNKDLQELIKEKQFRDDLYHRIAHVELTVPALRDRPEDIAAIAQHLLQKAQQENLGIELNPITSSFVDELRGQSLPGNIRELEKRVLHHAFGISSDMSAQPAAATEAKPPAVSPTIPANSNPPPEAMEAVNALLENGYKFQQIKTAVFQRAHTEENGNYRKAAYKANVYIDTLRNALKDHSDDITKDLANTDHIKNILDSRIPLEDLKMMVYDTALEQCGSDPKQAAILVGVSESVLKRRMKELELRQTAPCASHGQVDISQFETGEMMQTLLDRGLTLEDIQNGAIRAALETSESRTEAAKKLDIGRSTIHRHMAKDSSLPEPKVNL